MVLFATVLGLLTASGCAHTGNGRSSEHQRVDRRVEGQLVLEGIPPIPPEVSARMRQYQNVRGASLLDWDFEGGMLISTRFGETTQVHHLPFPGAARRQLSFFDEPIRGAWVNPSQLSPSMKTPGGLAGFVFLMDSGGGENHQLYWFDLESGKSRLLSDGTSRNLSPLPSRNSGVFAFASNARNGRDFDLWRVSPQGDEAPELLLELEGYWLPLDWSFDDSRILLLHYRSINSSRLHVFDLASQTLSPVPLPEGVQEVAYRAAAFLPSGNLIYASDRGGEFHRLVLHDLETGDQELVSPELGWDVSSLRLSDNGERLAYTVNEGGRSALYLSSTESPESLKNAEKIEIPVGVAASLAFDRSGRRLGLSLSGASTGSDVWTVELGGQKPASVGAPSGAGKPETSGGPSFRQKEQDLADTTAETRSNQGCGGEGTFGQGSPASERLLRWTCSEVGGLNPETFVTPTLVSFPSFDGREIPAWYYLPQQASAEHPVPVIVDIHGGPEAQSRAWFSSLAQHRVNELGVAVLYPNVRGSSGYGRSWLALDDGMKREDAVKDIGALLDWIATQAELDSSRVAVSGGSYGGYMVLASMIHFGDRLRCGVDVVGISHFVTFLENTESYRRDLRRAEYGDERDPEMRRFLHEISPLTQADKIHRPLFVAQGLNDPRVPASEAEQIVETVRKNGGEVWYFLARDEGHGFAKKSNRDAYLNAQTLFFENCLLQESGEEPSFPERD